jgi:hypothetical protein
MKQISVLTTALAVALFLACCQSGAADEKKPQSANPAVENELPAPPPDAPASSVARKTKAAATANTKPQDDQVQELIKIINETKSAYTLVATTIALAPLGEKAKVAVPVILRNAERLKLLESLGNPDSKKGEIATLLLESIYAIQAGTPIDGLRFQGPVSARPPVALPPAPATYYPAVTPVCPAPVCPAPPPTGTPPTSLVSPRAY